MLSTSDNPALARLEAMLYDPAAPGATATLLREMGHEPNRTLGQNFLVNRAILDRTVATAAVSHEDSVLEIGPGLGALSCRLVQAAREVTAIEKDASFIELLRRHLPPSLFHLVAADALRVSWDELNLPSRDVKVVANLPYSISKPMLRRLLEEWRPHLQSATVMVQREVADRLLAKPATSAYGPMAIMTTLYARGRRAFDVAPGSFVPAPKVTSSVVHLEMLAAPAIDIGDEKWFWSVVNAAFGQRRKQLGNTLKAVVADKSTLHDALAACDIDGQRRGETLTVAEFAALAKQLHSTI